jgi:hypothetical protein
MKIVRMMVARIFERLNAAPRLPDNDFREFSAGETQQLWITPY